MLKITARHLSKGFTLVELLIVIAIIGVLAAGVLLALDPIERINAANDAKVQQDVALISGAAQAYAAEHNGYYPRTLQDLIDAGSLKQAPNAPYGGSYTLEGVAGNSGSFSTSCTKGSTMYPVSGVTYCSNVIVYYQTRSKKYKDALSTTATVYQRFDSATGKTCQTTSTSLTATQCN